MNTNYCCQVDFKAGFVADIPYAGYEAQIWRCQERLEVLFLLPCEDWNHLLRNMASCKLFSCLLTKFGLSGLMITDITHSVWNGGGCSARVENWSLHPFRLPCCPLFS